MSMFLIRYILLILLLVHYIVFTAAANKSNEQSAMDSLKYEY